MDVYDCCIVRNRFAKRKNIHLMWMSRNTCMVALFEKQVRSGKNVAVTPEARPLCVLEVHVCRELFSYE